MPTSISLQPLRRDFGNEKIVVHNLNFFYDDTRALRDINQVFYDKLVTALIGPSGRGKSTLMRVLNRIYSLYAGQRTTGEVLLDGMDILDATADLNRLRAHVGMVFQRPTPFPMSIYDNVAFGIRLGEDELSRSKLDQRVEQALRRWPGIKITRSVWSISFVIGRAGRSETIAIFRTSLSLKLDADPVSAESSSSMFTRRRHAKAAHGSIG